MVRVRSDSDAAERAWTALGRSRWNVDPVPRAVAERRADTEFITVPRGYVR